MKKTKIVCSIGPASCPVDVMSQMVEAGMNVARINFSHATMEEREAVVASVKEVRKLTGKPIAILYDTKGPEFRNGMVKNGELKLVEGKTIRVVKENVLGDEERFSVNHPQALDSLEIGSVILLENGLMKIEVISKEEDGVTCKIVVGGVLGNKKSLAVPGVHLDIPFISEDDREDIIYRGGKVIVPSYYAKGLEFDGVIIVNFDDNTDDLVKYIMATRALHRLKVVNYK